MKVEMGNSQAVEYRNGDMANPIPLAGPAVYTWEVHDGAPYTMEPVADMGVIHQDILGGGAQLLQAGGGPFTAHLPDHEALVSVLSDWPNHSLGRPDWVASDHPALQEALAAFYNVPAGKPDWTEDRYWTRHAGLGLLAPGVIPTAVSPLDTTTNAGFDIRWGTVLGITAGAAGTLTASGTTSATDGGASWGTTQFIGCMVTVDNVYGNIISHTGTVLTIDRWYNAATPGGAAGSTPSATGKYIIHTGRPPCPFIGLTANSSAVGAGDTTLPGEITTASGGLIRKISPLAHTASATTGTLTPVFTANGSDSLPVTIAKIGISSSILSTVFNLAQTLLGTTAVVSLSGDQLTITDTITLS